MVEADPLPHQIQVEVEPELTAASSPLTASLASSVESVASSSQVSLEQQEEDEMVEARQQRRLSLVASRKESEKTTLVELVLAEDTTDFRQSHSIINNKAATKTLPNKL